MKRFTSYFLAAALLISAGCDSNIPETGTVNNALVNEVVLDDFLTSGIEMIIGNTMSISGYISALPIDATNTAQIYESSDESVATVSEDGILSAVGVGECFVTVYIGEEGVSGQFNVRVIPVPAVNITEMKFFSESAEYTFQLTADLKSSMVINPSDYSETIRFSSSNDKVVTVSEDGIMELTGVGEAVITAEVTGRESGNELSAQMTVKIPSLEYARFPGDGNGGSYPGVAREIMGTSVDQWDALPNADGGWSVYDFNGIETVPYQWNASTGARNCYRYAMLDNRRIVARTGGSNDLPNATNGTAFCWSRPGGNNNDKETSGIYFVIDMQKSQIVNYFRTVNISNHADDRGVSVTKVSAIYGTNDINPTNDSDWTLIAEDVTGFNTRDESTDPYTYMLETDKAYLNNTTPYRYIKFRFDKQDKCYGFYVGDSNTADRTGGTMQIAELYMGYDPSLAE